MSAHMSAHMLEKREKKIEEEGGKRTRENKSNVVTVLLLGPKLG